MIPRLNTTSVYCRATCLTLLLIVLVAVLPAQQQRPNIIFVFSDDHGAQAISAYGSNRNRTPAIDRLAEEGTLFRNAFCGNSICAPSRATILTGTHSHVNGHTTNERIFDNRQVAFPELLRQAGYQTALIGKWHLNVEPFGFDHWDKLINQGSYYHPEMIRNGQYLRRQGYTTDILTDLAIEWMSRERDTTRPFLLMYQHKAPHTPFDPALRHLTLYQNVTLPEPPTLFDEWETRSSAWKKAEMSIERHLGPRPLHLELPRYMLTDEEFAVWEKAYGEENRKFREANLSGKELVRWKYQRYAKNYLRTVASIDDGLGRVLEYLDRSGLAQNTIVIYSSDQGWFLGEHGMYDKRWMYEESLRMPLIIRWPGVTRPKSVVDALVHNIDFAPTFLEAAGVPIPYRMQGRSLVPLLRGQTPPDWRKSIYYHFYEESGAHRVPRHYGVRTDRYKLIHFYQLDEWEMYDLREDPLEVRNIADDLRYRPLRDSLHAKLRRLRGQYRVTEEADREATVFQASQQRRWSLIASFGRLPARWNIEVETLDVHEESDITRERVGYTIGDQKIEALVLTPRKFKGPRPAVLVVHPEGPGGSRAKGKSLSIQQQASTPIDALDLCRRGFVVMIPDRYGYESRRPGQNVRDEQGWISAEANRLRSNGSSLLAQEVGELWFAMIYLSRREGVHYRRVGLVGAGEGALLATLLAAVTDIEERGAALVSVDGPVSFADTTGRNRTLHLKSLLNLPQLKEWGDFEDVLPLVYPRPALFVGTSGGESRAKAKSRYSDRAYDDRLNLQDRVKESAEIHRTTVAWLERWLKTGY